MLLKRPKKSDSEKGSLSKSNYLSCLELRNISTTAGVNHQVLANLSLSIPPGKQTAIVSLHRQQELSLVQLILGHIQPTAGAIFLKGKEISDENRDDLRSRTYLTNPQPVIYRGTIADNITSAAQFDSDALIEAATKAGISTYFGKKGRDLLSFIEKTRPGADPLLRKQMELARGYYRSPELMIFRHPLHGLNTVQQHGLLRSLSVAPATAGALVICANLRMARHAHSVYVLDAGQLTPFSGQRSYWRSDAADQLWKSHTN